MANRGHVRERQVRKLLENDGWWVARAAGSLGDADLVACRRSHYTSLARIPKLAEVWLVEVKANKEGGPYMNFRPKDRRELIAAAERAGAEAVLCYWPPHKNPMFVRSEAWPDA